MKLRNCLISELKTNRWLFSCSYGDATLARTSMGILKMLNKYKKNKKEIEIISIVSQQRPNRWR